MTDLGGVTSKRRTLKLLDCAAISPMRSDNVTPRNTPE
jgi:hypothetical protein